MNNATRKACVVPILRIERYSTQGLSPHSNDGSAKAEAVQELQETVHIWNQDRLMPLILPGCYF